MSNEWIKTFAKARGIPILRIAEALDVGNARVHEMISGKRQIKVEEIPKLAALFGLPNDLVLSYVTGGSNVDSPSGVAHIPVSAVKIAGVVAAGLWRPVGETLEGDGLLGVPSFVLEQSPSAFALRVEGDSMNLKYKDGDFVVCEPVSEYRGDLRNGLDVVVQRRSRDSASAEVTLKEVVIRNGELWLVPRSDNPAHQPIMLRNNIDQHFDDGGDPPVSVTAVVTYSVQRRA